MKNLWGIINRRLLYNLCAGLFCCFFLVSCREKKNEAKITWTKLPAEATVEVAQTKEERAKGLMFRDYLQNDCGMYFVMEKEEIQNFWMKDTRISLDIAFIDSANIIVSMKNMRAYDVAGTSSDAPAKYALEMERNWFKDKGILVGDMVVLDDKKVFFYRANAQSED
jgi:uncharacterized membrane protein (UPF0127 family)